MNPSWKKRLLALVLAVSLLAAVMPMASSAAAAFSDVGGWYESIFAELSGTKASEVYSVYWKNLTTGKTTSMPSAERGYLVRDVDGITRIDIPGLAAGSYTLTVKSNNGTVVQENITVYAYDRSGFAHWNYTEGVGAYKDDGTLKDNAVVLYVTEATKNTVSVTAGGVTVTGIGNILNTGGYTVSSGYKQNTNQHILKKLAEENRPLVVRIIGHVTAPEGVTAWGSRDYGGNPDDNGSMAYMKSCRNITVEGIGNDAIVDGWGFGVNTNSGDTAAGLGKNFEFRNLTFRNVPEDCIGFSGRQSGSTLTDPIRHGWVHHCAFYGPKNLPDASEDQDKGGGDGALDFKCGEYFTMSYCYYEAYHKTHLIGGSDSNLQYHVTWHHNYYKNCESRAPLGRQANMHLYNNLFEGQSSYCMSLRANCYIFSEYNNYINCNKVSQNSGGGVCKSYNNNFTNCTGTTASDIVTVSSKSQTVTSGNLYANFDTNASLSYIPGGNYSLQTNTAEAKATVMAYAGPQKGAVTEEIEPAPTEPTTETTQPTAPSVDPSEYVHNFTTKGKSSNFYNIIGNLSNKGNVSYNGLTLSQCLKMESATGITFTAPKNGKLLLVFHNTGLNNAVAADANVALDGTRYEVDAGDGYAYVEIPVTAGTHEIQRGNTQIFLYYMAYIPDTQPITFTNVSMNLGNSLTMYFKLNAADVPEGCKAVITKNYADGREPVVTEIAQEDWLTEGELYSIPVNNIAAKEMSDIVSVVIVNEDGEEISEAKNSSVRAYAMMTLNTSSDAKLLTLMAELLNYGAAAQQQFNYGTSDLANAKMNATHQSYATADTSILVPKANRGDAIKVQSFNMTLESSLLLNLKYYPADVTENMTAKVSYTTHAGTVTSYEIPGSAFEMGSDGYLWVSLSSLAAADINTVATVEIVSNGEVISTTQINMAVAVAIDNGATPAMTAMSRYCVAAYNFFH